MAPSAPARSPGFCAAGETRFERPGRFPRQPRGNARGRNHRREGPRASPPGEAPTTGRTLPAPRARWPHWSGWKTGGRRLPGWTPAMAPAAPARSPGFCAASETRWRRTKFPVSATDRRGPVTVARQPLPGFVEVEQFPDWLPREPLERLRGGDWARETPLAGALRAGHRDPACENWLRSSPHPLVGSRRGSRKSRWPDFLPAGNRRATPGKTPSRRSARGSRRKPVGPRPRAATQAPAPALPSADSPISFGSQTRGKRSDFLPAGNWRASPGQMSSLRSARASRRKPARPRAATQAPAPALPSPDSPIPFEAQTRPYRWHDWGAPRERRAPRMTACRRLPASPKSANRHPPRLPMTGGR